MPNYCDAKGHLSSLASFAVGRSNGTPAMRALAYYVASALASHGGWAVELTVGKRWAPKPRIKNKSRPKSTNDTKCDVHVYLYDSFQSSSAELGAALKGVFFKHATIRILDYANLQTRITQPPRD